MSQNPFAKVAAGTAVPGTAQAQPTATPATAAPVTAQPAVNPNPQVIPAGGVNLADDGRGKVEEVTFDSDVKITALDRLPKMKKDEVSRIAFILFNEGGSPLMKMSNYFYDEQAKRFFIAPKNPEVLKRCVAKLGEPKIRFATVVVRYETDQNGTMLDYGGGAWSYKLFAFTFGTDKFPNLKSLHKEWGLQNVDLLFTCSDIDFQKMTISPARQCIFRSNAEVTQQILAEAQSLYDNHLNRHLGNSMTDEEILVAIGAATAPAPGGAHGPVVGGNPFGGGASTPGQAGGGFGNLVQH